MKDVQLTKEGGYYYRALAWHWAFVSVLIVPMFVLLVVALLNPLWFRSAMFNMVERWAGRLARFRDRVKYRIYLGTDPTVWHALKD